jgi:hypothetical protein
MLNLFVWELRRSLLNMDIPFNWHELTHQEGMRGREAADRRSSRLFNL